jgi:hypothetical protein
MTELDQEELEILAIYEAGKAAAAPNAKALLAEHMAYADVAFKKDARINIRLTAKDLRGLQKRAIAEGIPFQTLAASVLHKYVDGRLTESP